MECKSVHIIYFSPTHTSARTAYAIAEGMRTEALLESDFTCEAARETVWVTDVDCAIVAVPVYGGRVAETAVERLRSLRGKRTPVVPVVLYGNRDYEDALLELSDLLTGQGFIPVAAAAFVGEHSFSRDDMPIAAGRPDDADLEAAMRFGRTVVMKMNKASSLSALTPVKVKGNHPYREKTPSKPQAPVVDPELCNLCDYCSGVCPVGAIAIRDGEAFSDAALCIKCCACVKECPEGARSFDTPYTAMLHTNCSARREAEVFV